MHDFATPTGTEWAALGAFGGVVRVIVTLLKEKQVPPPLKIFWLVVANGLVSGFSGFLGAITMSLITPNDNLHVIAAGIFGWLGVSGLDYLSDVVRKKIKV